MCGLISGTEVQFWGHKNEKEPDLVLEDLPDRQWRQILRIEGGWGCRLELA